MRSLLSLLVFFVFLDCIYAQPIDMIYVEGGSFTMGCTPEQKPCNNNERIHDVAVSSFYMSKYEITQGQWNTTMDSLPLLLQDGSNFPMYGMSWLDAIVFCNKLSQIEQRTPAYYADSNHTMPFGWDGQKWVFINPGNFTGNVYYKPNTSGYRLPTEAEWEYAARGGLNSQKYRYAGSDAVSQIMSMGTLSSVGTFLPNEMGIYDLSGNLGEWCMDTYTIDHQGLCNPGLSSSYPQNANVVVRGGHYILNNLDEFRNATRAGLPLLLRSNSIGIRIVRSGDIRDYQWLACPTMLSPTPSSTNAPVLPRIQWTSVPDATSYTISIGTSPGGSHFKRCLIFFRSGRQHDYTNRK
ncbi:MAG TPA: SUMF1/EgtB/PvdO family nonheme iron enzyme [Saprospiraceae bacterium]|jgi:formylglycine-generating enzyme required for sulfatase activity|nr:SUMF1/EgtB/PvdO family nonheme iron enzyme [Saprospiraceae bacterium]